MRQGGVGGVDGVNRAGLLVEKQGQDQPLLGRQAPIVAPLLLVDNDFIPAFEYNSHPKSYVGTRRIG